MKRARNSSPPQRFVVQSRLPPCLFVFTQPLLRPSHCNKSRTIWSKSQTVLPRADYADPVPMSDATPLHSRHAPCCVPPLAVSGRLLASCYLQQVLRNLYHSLQCSSWLTSQTSPQICGWYHLASPRMARKWAMISWPCSFRLLAQ